MKVELELNVPEGYEATGEYRSPQPGEYYLNSHDKALLCSSYGYVCYFPILHKVYEPAPWLPDGCWLYHDGIWWVSREKPLVCYVYPGGVSVAALAELYGEDTFVAPPANPYQVRKT